MELTSPGAGRSQRELLGVAGQVVGTTGLRQTKGFLFEELERTLVGPLLYKTIDDMMLDAVVAAMLIAVEILVRRCEFSVVPGDEKEPASVKAAEFVDECWRDMDMPMVDWLSEGLTFLPYGFQLSEILYKERRGLEHPDEYKRSRSSDGRVGWHSWSPRSQETVYRWDIDTDGRIDGVFQFDPYNAWQRREERPAWPLAPGVASGPGGEVWMPIQKLIHLRTTTRRNNPEGRSVLRGALRAWWMKKNLERIEAIGAERDLTGLPVLVVPPEVLLGKTPENAAALEYAKQIIQGARSDEQAGIILPGIYDTATGKPLWEFSLLTSGGSRQVGIREAIEDHKQQMASVLLADFMQLGHKGVGSFALADNKSLFFSAGVEAWLDVLCAGLNTQAVPRLLRLNGIKCASPPRFKHGDVQEVTLEAIGTLLQKAALAGANFFGDDESGLALMQLLSKRLGFAPPKSLPEPLLPAPTGINPSGQTGGPPTARPAAPGQKPSARPAAKPGGAPSPTAARRTAPARRAADPAGARDPVLAFFDEALRDIGLDPLEGAA